MARPGKSVENAIYAKIKQKKRQGKQGMQQRRSVER